MPGTIKAVIGKPKSGNSTSTKVQTLIFPKSGWEKSEVTGWLKSHDKKSGIDETEDSYRARQEDPDGFKPDSFRTIELGKGKADELDDLEAAYEMAEDAHDIHIDIGEGHVDKVVKSAEKEPDAQCDSEKMDDIEGFEGNEDQNYATVGGQKVEKSDFAYAPAGSKPSEWKYPVHDASHARNALARWGQHKGIPSGAEAGVLAKIKRAAKRFGVKVDPAKYADVREMVPKDTKQYIKLPQAEVHMATWLSSVLPEPVSKDGKAMYRMPIAVTGSWYKGDHSFSITAEDLRDIVANFNKRHNGMVPIDYEHASEQPEVARGGDVPAAGWIHSLSIERNGKAKLMADVEWTDKATSLIRTSQYRFFSPAIDWGFKDKKTGEGQGATLTSGALTNHPFLEELPQITLREQARSQGAVLMSDLADRKGDKTIMAKKFEELEGDDFRVPKVVGKKIPSGNPHAGHIALNHAETGKPVGYMTKGHLADLAEKHLPDGDDDEKEEMRFEEAEESEEMTRRKMRVKKGEETEDMDDMRKECQELKEKNEDLSQRLEDLRKERGKDAEDAEEFRKKSTEKATEKALRDVGAEGMTLAEVKRLVEAGRKLAANDGKRILLKEACPDGVLDKPKAAVVTSGSKGAVSTADYVAVDTASSLIDKAVQQGKILRREAKFYLLTAIERPAEFDEWLKDAIPRVRMGVEGLGTSDTMSVDQEVEAETKRVMSEVAEVKGNRSKAHAYVMKNVPGLKDRYDQYHRQIVRPE
jgi:phage I-like protein